LLTGYISAHWRGDQSLAWSFWVNLVAIRAAIIITQIVFTPAEQGGFHSIAPWVWALVLVLHGIVFVWQVVGVLRSAEVHLRDTGSQAGVWGAQIALVAFFWLTASYSLEALRLTLAPPVVLDHLAKMDREHASKYALTVSNDRRVLSIVGSIELGITRNTEALVKKTPDLKLVILESDGGNVFEARGLARVFRENNLDTHVETSCSSACSLAFIGGKHRTITPRGRIGFHQYRFDSSISIIAADPAEEQQRDRELFSVNGVSEAFLEKMFQSRSAEMWFPNASELLEASVIQEVSERKDVLSGMAQ